MSVDLPASGLARILQSTVGNRGPALCQNKIADENQTACSCVYAYACAAKHGSVKQAETPLGPVPGGRFDFGLVAQVVTSTICDHLPLYRQQDVLARAGIELSRSTLCEIMASAAFLLEPLAALLKLAAEALGFFQQLYDIEDRARELSPEARQALREAEATPLLEKLRLWADKQAAHSLPKLKFGEALGYLRNQWEPLTNYVQDGRLPIDNNATERDLRALTIGRKNWLFIGSPEAGPRAAILYTVVASAARHDLDVWAYLRDVLEQLARGGADLSSLLPDAWAAAHPEAIRTYQTHPPPTPPRPRASQGQSALASQPWADRTVTLLELESRAGWVSLT